MSPGLSRKAGLMSSGRLKAGFFLMPDGLCHAL